MSAIATAYPADTQVPQRRSLRLETSEPRAITSGPYTAPHIVGGVVSARRRNLKRRSSARGSSG